MANKTSCPAFPEPADSATDFVCHPAVTRRGVAHRRVDYASNETPSTNATNTKARKPPNASSPGFAFIDLNNCLSIASSSDQPIMSDG